MLFCVRSAGASESIKVVTEDWPPYNFSMPNGEVGGISTKIVRRVLDQSGLNYDIQVYPWARSFDMARTKPNVMIYSIFRSREREHLFKWICPLTEPVKLYLYRLTNRTDVDVKTIMDAKNYTTGVTRGDYPHHYLTDLGFVEKQHLQLSPDDDLNVRKMLNGRVDLVVEAELTMRSILTQTDAPYHTVIPILQIRANDSAPNCMAFSKKTPDSVVQRVRDALKIINAARLDISKKATSQ